MPPSNLRGWSTSGRRRCILFAKGIIPPAEGGPAYNSPHSPAFFGTTAGRQQTTSPGGNRLGRLGAVRATARCGAVGMGAYPVYRSLSERIAPVCQAKYSSQNQDSAITRRRPILARFIALALRSRRVWQSDCIFRSP
jgi:hypothetical protein